MLKAVFKSEKRYRVYLTVSVKIKLNQKKVVIVPCQQSLLLEPSASCFLEAGCESLIRGTQHLTPG